MRADRGGRWSVACRSSNIGWQRCNQQQRSGQFRDKKYPLSHDHPRLCAWATRSADLGDPMNPIPSLKSTSMTATRLCERVMTRSRRVGRDSCSLGIHVPAEEVTGSYMLYDNEFGLSDKERRSIKSPWLKQRKDGRVDLAPSTYIGGYYLLPRHTNHQGDFTTPFDTEGSMWYSPL